MDTNKTTEDVQATTDRLLTTLSGFSEERFNTRSSTGRWSAGDIAEHLYILDTRVNKILQQPALPAERPHDQKAGMIESSLLDRNQKYTVPDFIRPSTTEKDQQEIISKLQAERQELIHIVQSIDLTEMVSTNHIRLGSLTRLEWIYFSIYHTQRHIAQLEELKKEIPA